MNKTETIILSLCITASILGLFVSAYTVGVSVGVSAGRSRIISFCIENPDKCKLEYKYNKMKEENEKNSN